MKFAWDENKNRLNIKKHGIDFADVAQMFDQPMLVRPDDRFDYGEERWIGIGLLNTYIVTVAFTERGETIRIISARKASKHEAQKYKKSVTH